MYALLIPCYNCSNTIEHVINESKKYIDKIFIIDDGSVDNSWEVNNKSDASVIRLDKNHGVGYALNFGMNLLFSDGFDSVISLDSDGAHNPSDIPNLIRKHESSNSILTIGNRWSNLSEHIPSSKWWANRFASLLISKIVGFALPDVSCGFRIIRSDFQKTKIKNPGYGYLYDMIFHGLKIGKIDFTPIDVRYDACDNLLTKQKEIIDLLHSCYNNSLSNPELSQKVSLLEKHINNWATFTVIFNTITGSVPITARSFINQGYLFHIQNSTFINSPEYININL